MVSIPRPINCKWWVNTQWRWRWSWRFNPELFDTLLLWQASALVDAQGFAHFTVPINDSLTSFKVVAIASSREQFGTGSQSFRSSQEVQVLSGLPLTVRDGDNYQAEFTVRNSSEQADNIDVTVDSPALKTPFKTRLTLAANSSQLVTIPIIVPVIFHAGQ